MAGRLVLAALAVVTACGQTAPQAEPATSAPATTAVTTVPATTPPPTTAAVPAPTPCDAIPPVEAPAERYRNGPVYTSNEQPIEEIRDWALQRPGFQEVWVDRDNFGWVALGFIGDVSGVQAELEADFPEVGVVAVEVPVSLSELDALAAQAVQLLRDAGVEAFDAGPSIPAWAVRIGADASDPAVVEALAPLAGQRLCIEDSGPGVPEGPQPQAGAGWRLLADELVGESYRTGIATDAAQYEELWRTVGLPSERPPVDFGSEVVVWFGAVYGQNCQIRLDDVVVDGDLVHATTVVPGPVRACLSDANPHAFVVALDRSRLPAGAFAVQLGPHDPPGGVPEERTLVAADLSVPGAVASADQIGPDPELIAAAGALEPEVSGGIIEAGYPWPYRPDTHCGVTVLGEINDIWWMTDEGAGTLDYVPAAWGEANDDIVVEILMTEGPDPVLTATLDGHTVTYRPVPFEQVPLCD